jgi:hypothetical protein
MKGNINLVPRFLHLVEENSWYGLVMSSAKIYKILQVAIQDEVNIFYLFLFILFIEFVTIQKKNYIDEDNYVTGERTRTFVPLET